MMQRLLEDAAQGDAVALARALVRVPSVNPSLEEGGTGEAEVAELCAGWLEGWGFQVERSFAAPGRANVVARMGKGPRRILLNGHLDTVGVGGMTVPPFQGEVVDGRLLGRGSCDMKGGIASILSAAAALAREGWEEGELVVALVADEEHASIGAQALVEAGLTADLCVVCEPTSLAVAPAHKGFAWTEVVVHGRAAHGSRPERGIDAIRNMGQLLVALSEIEARLEAAPAHPLLGRGSIHAGTVVGGRAPSVYPDLCTLVLERRLLPGEAVAQGEAEIRELVARLEARIPDFRATVTGGLTRPGTEVAEDHTLVLGLLQAMVGQGLAPVVAPMSAWVDAAVFNEAGIPSVCFGPGSIEQAHAADEWCPIEEIEVAARVLEDWVRGVLPGT
jgi:acetylornithine deacetylase